MSFAARPICPFCETGILSALRRAHRYPQWQTTRAASQLQRRRPSRMQLSPAVARPPVKPRMRDDSSNRRRTAPFETTNRSRTSFRPEFQRRRTEHGDQAVVKPFDRTRPRNDLNGRRQPTASTAVSRERDDSDKQRLPGPFANMNRTRAGAQVEAERRRAEGREQSRARGRMEKRKDKSREREPGEMKSLKMQRALSGITYGERNSVKRSIDDVESFNDFELLPAIKEAIPASVLSGLVDITPTPIQRLAIPAMLGTKGRRGAKPTQEGEMRQFLLAAETGSGKTLAYLLPTVDAIKRAELEEAKQEEAKKAAEEEEPEPKRRQSIFEIEPPPLPEEPHPTSGRPRAVVLVPTSELVDQVGRVFKAFSHAVKLRVSLISASYSPTVIRNRLFGPGGIDIVISTPHLLGNIAENEPNVLSRVTHLIVDEADSLFDRSFAPLTSAILDRATPSLKQLVLCSATIPRSLDSLLWSRFPDMQRLATPNLHAIPRRVQLATVDIDKQPYNGSRDLACADAVWAIGRQAAEHGATDDGAAVTERVDVKRILVFVNERERAQELAEYLVAKGVDAVALNRDTTEQRRSEIFTAFTSKHAPGTEPAPEPAPKSRVKEKGKAAAPPLPGLANTKVLVTTDLGSRGIDTINVRHVILYDLPHTTIDFIHRLGRTGRMGRRGRGIVLVGKKDRKDIVREVREAMFMGKALI